MFLTPHWQPIMEMVLGLHRLEERDPSILAFLAVHECLHVSKHDNAVPCSGQQNVEPFTGCKEAYVAVAIAPSQRHDHNIRLLALIVVCGASVVP